MGDLRNKRQKFEDDERWQRQLLEQQARDAKRARDNPLLTCRCGLTWQQVPIQWVYNSTKYWKEPEYFCPSCLPFEHYELLAGEIAKVPGIVPENPPNRILAIGIAIDPVPDEPLPPDTRVIMTCEECFVPVRKRADQVFTHPKHPGKPVMRSELDKPIKGFRCTGCRKSVLLVIRLEQNHV